MSTPLVRLYNVDAMKFRLDMVRNFDVLYTDPPYSEHVHKNAVSQSKVRGVRSRDLGFSSLSDPLRVRIAEFAANVKRWSLVFSDVESSSQLSQLAQSKGAEYIRTVPWIRWSSPQLSGDRPPTGMEHILVHHGRAKGRKAWSGPGNLLASFHSCLRGEGKHKAAKPLDQCLDFVSWFTRPGQIVFDPCAGHAPIGLACILLGRGYVGLELDEKCWVKGAVRLSRLKRGSLSRSDSVRFNRWLENSSYEPVSKGLSRLALLGTAARKADKDRVRAQWGHVLGV